ncbi:MAG TPA: spermidine synthase [Eoetvoesiella sp.]
MTHYPPVTTSEHKGLRHLHIGSPWIQGSMRLGKPDALELEYVQQMMMWLLFDRQPRHIVQLGLGAGSLAKFCYKNCPQSRVTAVEINPQVIAVCASMFALPPNDERLNVIEMDALDFVMSPSNHGIADILQVDLYDDNVRGPALNSSEFYQACANCLTPEGIMTTNLFCDYGDYGKNLEAMVKAFGAVVWLPPVHDGNVVIIAFKHAPQVDFSSLYERAAEIRTSLQLPAESWVDGLQTWMQDD